MKKQLYKSKTVWAAAIAAVLGIYTAFGYSVPAEIYTVLGALGLYGLRDAMK